MAENNALPPVSRDVPEALQPGGRIFALACRDIHPFIRIAHRLGGGLNIPERIIVDHELVFIVAGQGQFSTREAAIDFAPGDCLFIQPFVPHAFGGDRCEHIAVHFDFAMNVPPRGKDLTRRKPYEIRLSDGVLIAQKTAVPDLQNDFIALVDARESTNATAPLEVQSLFLRILLKLMNRPAPSLTPNKNRNEQRIARAMEFLRQHLGKPLDAQKLADVAGLSLSHFSRLFLQQTGYSPMHYLRQVRIQHARQLLADVDLSIKQIARQCGFDDPYHFSKTFHQLDGLSPTLYREALLAGTRR